MCQDRAIIISNLATMERQQVKQGTSQSYSITGGGLKRMIDSTDHPLLVIGCNDLLYYVHRDGQVDILLSRRVVHLHNTSS